MFCPTYRSAQNKGLGLRIFCFTGTKLLNPRSFKQLRNWNQNKNFTLKTLPRKFARFFFFLLRNSVFKKNLICVWILIWNSISHFSRSHSCFRILFFDVKFFVFCLLVCFCCCCWFLWLLCFSFLVLQSLKKNYLTKSPNKINQNENSTTTKRLLFGKNETFQSVFVQQIRLEDIAQN